MTLFVPNIVVLFDVLTDKYYELFESCNSAQIHNKLN